ncbi:DUF4998 domain-containing protein [Niabella ginsengisoli]|uniref:DUF4998 domain-containing protein n=1 Tax=Niabella ginsengisoli TaxID=522298 RepID=A0ABS9SGS7_9BACT|nr:DUF4998 domain-containing protein [Niabella ginsengisoli]MCH5597573.1 DUF4998 domain-containing protein [Niabella ginsengisoli]
MNNLRSSVFLFSIGIVVSILSCSKMDDSYKKFVVPNGLTYIGKVENLYTNAGNERIKLSWVTKDPKAKIARIYWNNKADSVDVQIQTSMSTDTTSVIINNLAEGTYVFQIYTLDNENNKSVSVESIGISYGVLYESLLNNRVITKITKTQDTAFISVLSIDSTSIGTRFSYMNKQNIPFDTLVTSIEERIIKLPNMNSDTSFIYKTLYKPKTSIDTFYSAQTLYPK